MLEATGEEGKLEASSSCCGPIGIQEVVRTGKVAIARGPKTRVRKVERSRASGPGRRARDQDPQVVGFAD